jgi:hypothetical protein
MVSRPAAVSLALGCDTRASAGFGHTTAPQRLGPQSANSTAAWSGDRIIRMFNSDRALYAPVSSLPVNNPRGNYN